MTDDRIRGLEETVTAQAQRLAEIAKLHDLAHEAKQHLIGEHARERTKRQTLEAVTRDAATVIAGLLDALDMKPDATEREVALERANAWLAEHGDRS